MKICRNEGDDVDEDIVDGDQGSRLHEEFGMDELGSEVARTVHSDEVFKSLLKYRNKIIDDAWMMGHRSLRSRSERISVAHPRLGQRCSRATILFRRCPKWRRSAFASSKRIE